MRSERALKTMWSDPRMKELIESLWREYPGLYNEKYSSDPEKWLLNVFSNKIDFGQALGQDHVFAGNQSTAIGIGAITKAFREIILGSYPTEDIQGDPKEWVALNRLITVGKGVDDANREDALIMFKSGLLKLFNSLIIGKYDHTDEIGFQVQPDPGTLQYTPEKSLELYQDQKWNKVGDKNFHYEQLFPARVWQINHNLDKTPSVTIRDFENMEHECEVFHYDKNTTLLTFSVPFSGYADVN